jgi:hypothetical protein
MDEWFSRLAAECELDAGIGEQLDELGFAVIPGPVSPAAQSSLAAAYDAVFAAAKEPDFRIGRSCTRVAGLVNHAELDAVYVFPPLLAACCRVIGSEFKLSSLNARTVRPVAAAQALHVDLAPDARGFPLVGYILMVDDFRPDNGATRFVPGSHRWTSIPTRLRDDRVSPYAAERLACGAAGSLIVYNGSTWHGYSANTSQPRRSIQGAFVRRDVDSRQDLPSRVTPATLARVSPLARYLIGV